jgi:hypothetical protein
VSYDLIIRPNASYSLFTPYGPLKEFLLSLPCVVPNGTAGFALDDRPRRWMEIYLAIVDADGNAEDIASGDPIAINSIQLCLRYSATSNDPEKDYLPTAVAISRFLRWQIYDPQSDVIIPNSAVMPVRPFRKVDD